MRIVQRQTLTGQLFSWRKGQNPKWEDLPHVSLSPTKMGWLIITLRTEQPLLVEDDLTAREFFYEYLLRTHGEHVIFLSNHSNLVEIFMRRTNLLKVIRKPSIAVDRLVKELSEKPHGVYTISRVYADVEGFGRKLRAISLYGDDLVDVPTFQDLLPVLVAHRAELRNVTKRANVLCVDIDGSIDFFYRDKSSLDLMLEAISFLSTGIVKDESGKEPSKVKRTKPFIQW